MTTTAPEAPPIERLAEVVGAGVLGAAAVAAGHGVPEDVRVELDKPLDESRVRTKPGRGNLSYLATHDVIRTANRIFGYGRWGYEVVDLTPLGTTPKTGNDGKKGVYVGYRCTVRLTIAGCVPVSGVGYGDGVEYQEQSPVTSHELAVKEAESDALKRAFRNFGDQFGLILYAKDDERRRIEAEQHAAETAEDREARRQAWIAENAASDEEVEAVKEMASRVGPDVREKTDAAIKQHRDKNETDESRNIGRPIVTKEFLAKLAEGIGKQGNDKAVEAGDAARDDAAEQPGAAFKLPEGVQVGTEGIGDGPVDGDAVATGFAE